MTDETEDFWIALWKNATERERQALKHAAEKAELLWFCGCPLYHDMHVQKCWQCGRWRDPEAQIVVMDADRIVADFWEKLHR